MEPLQDQVACHETQTRRNSMFSSGSVGTSAYTPISLGVSTSQHKSPELELQGDVHSS